MTFATLAFVVALLGWAPIAVVFSWSLYRLRRDLDMVMRVVEHQSRSVGSTLIAIDNIRAAENQNAIDICRIGDMASDTVGEVSAHAKTLDHHTDRLSVLERER